jgi:uncharacterized protein YciI
MRGQASWKEHALYMDALAERGIVVLGGTLDHDEQVLLIFNAPDPQAVEAYLANDPWTSLGLWVVASIQRWEILLGPNLE